MTEAKLTDQDDPLAGIDLDAWQPPPLARGIADGVIRQMRDPVPVAAAEFRELGARRRRRWPLWLGAGVLAAAAATLLIVPQRGTGPVADRSGDRDPRAEPAPLQSQAGVGPIAAPPSAAPAVAAAPAASAAPVASAAPAAAAVAAAPAASAAPAAPVASAAPTAPAAAPVAAPSPAPVASPAPRTPRTPRTPPVAAPAPAPVASPAPAPGVPAPAPVAAPTPPRRAPGTPAPVAAPAPAPGVPAPAPVATVSPAPRAPGVPAPAAAAPASRAQLARSATPAPAPAPTPAPDIDAEDPDADPDAEPAAPAAPPAPAPISLPRNVPPNLLESQRIRGNHTIMPDDDEKKAIEAAKEDRVIAAVKLCIDTSGKVSQVKMLRSSGYPGYDRKIRRELKIWEYRPFMLDGKPTAVCTAVSFIYTQK